MPKSLLFYKNEKLWIPDNYLEIILYYCSKLPIYKQNDQEWMVALKDVIPLYLQGFIPGGIDLKFNENLINSKRIDFFIQLLKETGAIISSQGKTLSIEDLNQIEKLKGEDAVLWKEALATETITDVINQLIAMIERKEVDALAILKTKNTTPLSKNPQESSTSATVLQQIKLKKKLSLAGLELKKNVLYDGIWDEDKTIVIPVSKIDDSYTDQSFKFTAFQQHKFADLQEALSANELEKLMTVSNIISRPLGDIMLYKTQLNHTVYYQLKQFGETMLLFCFGCGEVQSGRWKITLESIHVVTN